MILLDTDHCVYFIRARREVVAAFHAHAADEPAISIFSLGELYFGALRSARPSENIARCQALAERLTVVPADAAIMMRFAEIKSYLCSRGELLEDPDLLIAATALSLNVPLVTHNIAHFSRIPGLQLQDWSV